MKKSLLGKVGTLTVNKSNKKIKVAGYCPRPLIMVHLQGLEPGTH